MLEWLTGRRKAPQPTEPAPQLVQQASRSRPIMSDEAVALLARKNRTPPAEDIFKPAVPPPGVVPEGTGLAMDDALSGVGGWAGQTYGSSLGGFGAAIPMTVLALYAQRAEYRKIADVPATEMTRRWIKITSIDQDDDKTDRIQAIEAGLVKFKVRDAFRDAVRYDGLMGRGHVYIDIGAQGDEKAKPIGNGSDAATLQKIKLGSLKGIRSVDPLWVYPKDYNTNDPLAPDHYKPQSWYVMGGSVHASRLLTIVGREVPDILKSAYSFGGLSLTQMAQPYVDNWLKTRQSVADIVRAFTVWVLKTNLQTGLMGGAAASGGMSDGGGLDARLTLFNMLRDNLGVMAISKDDEDFANVSANLGTLDKLQAQAQEQMCVRKGTLIETDRGQVAVENVTLNDKVMTRNGYAPVAWSGVTKYVSRMVVIETSVSTLYLTEEHPVWSETEGAFVTAENVNPSHLLKKSPAWAFTGSRSCGEATYGAERGAGTSEIRKLAGSCIVSFTRHTSALSRMAWTFITWMATGSTTTCQTYASCLAGNTTPSMNQKGLCEPLGTSFRSNASNAGSCILPRFPVAHGSVQATARAALGAPIGVKTVTRFVCDEEPVYDITVADGHLPEFYANGILVHNSSVASIPLVKLLGVTPSGLNATSDGEIRVFYDSIHAAQEDHLRDPLQTVIDIVQLSECGDIDPSIRFGFEPLWAMSERERAEVEKLEAETDQVRVDSGVLSPIEVRGNVASDPDSRYPGLDVEDAPDLSAEEAEGLQPKGQTGAEDARRFFADDADWHESDHDRDDGGKFSSSGSGHERLTVTRGLPQGGAALTYDPVAKAFMGDNVPHDRIKKLAIPPGWQNVRLAHDEGADLQVLATDAKGRPQYRYSEAFATSNKAAKHERVETLMQKHHEIEAATLAGVKGGSDTAAAVRLMHLTGMRPGGDEDTGADKKAHGATTLLKHHVEVDGDKVHYDFTGKKGVRIKNTVHDGALAEHIARRLSSNDGDRLFQTDASKANAFVKKTVGGDFKSKDLRTATANRIAADLVSTLPKPTNAKEHHAATNHVGDVVSSQLGNTRAVALKDYINPAVFSSWGGEHGKG